MQAALIVMSGLATVPLLWQTQRAGMPLAAGLAVVIALVGGSAFAAFLMLIRFRALKPLSLRDDD